MNINELLAASGVVHQEPVRLPVADGTRLVHLHAGELVIASEPTQITTILGSCVAICLWDPALRIGGMNHYMLAEDRGAATDTGRYAGWATRALVDRLIAQGAACDRLRAKIFGGAAILNLGASLGEKNVEAARRRLASRGIPVVAEDVGGTRGRKLVFRTDTGLSMVKQV